MRIRFTRQMLLFSVIVLLALIVGSLSSAAEIEVEPAPGSQTRFQRTVRYLQTADSQLRSEFATVALSKMADAYTVEARLARQQASTRKNTHLGVWSATVDRYARQMSLLIEDIDLGLPVSFNVGPDATLAVTVGERTVIVSHPRLNQQSVLEQDVLMDFCGSHSCEQFSPRDSWSTPIPVAAALVHPKWNFTELGWNCSNEGITVHFNSDQNMTSARLICERFLQEVMTLTDELAWQQRHDVLIKWDELEIQATPGRPEHMVRLNAVGDAILVTIPLLYSNPSLLKQVAPWMRGRIEGHRDLDIVLEASRYGWQKP